MPQFETNALDVANLCKAYGHPVVDHLNLQVRAGELFALLGSNGAGKTTSLRMVAGLLQPDAGQIRIFGIDSNADPIAARKISAWVPDEPAIYDKLTPQEYLTFVAGLWSVPPDLAKARTEELLSTLNLCDIANRRCEEFSRGMKQKVALAGALVHDPKLLLLDEPLTGLDAAMARIVKDVLDARVRAGATIILTTHILEVAERMADRIAIMHQGRIVANGTLGELRAQAGNRDATLEELFLNLVSAKPAVPA